MCTLGTSRSNPVFGCDSRVVNFVRPRWDALDRLIDTRALEPADRQLFERLRAVLHVELGNRMLSVDGLADELEISRRHLLRRTEAAIGWAPSALVREVRLLEADRLLGSGQVGTVASVARAVGFTPPYFSRAYRARFGRTASSRLRRRH